MSPAPRARFCQVETLPKFTEKVSLESQLINVGAKFAKSEITEGPMVLILG